MKNSVTTMKLIAPIMVLFLASCGVHNSRYDAEQDTYYQDDYYAYDNYDPYYGYGSSGYSTAGDGIYYNDYNYYPDRWGVNYSNTYYSPYRHPRVGFYFSSSYGCGYSYWSHGCSSGFWPSTYYATSVWPSYGFGIGYSNYYYDNYWWYNHWRHRNYEPYRPTQQGYYSARNEALRLNNSRYYNRYKNDRSNRQYNNNSRNNPNTVNRNRSSSNIRSGNNTRSATRYNKPARQAKPVQRSRQEAASIGNSQGPTSNRLAGTSRSQVSSNNSNQVLQQRVNQRYVERNLPSNRNQNQQPAADSNRNQVQRNNSIKPMNSQSPVYYTNSRPGLQNNNQVQTQPFRQRSLSNQPVQTPNQINRVAPSNPNTYTRPVAPIINKPAAQNSQPQSNNRSANRSRNANKNKDKSDSNNKSSGNRDRQRLQ